MNRPDDGRVTADELARLLAALRLAPMNFVRMAALCLDACDDVNVPLAPDTWSGIGSIEARRLTADALERFGAERRRAA